MAAAKIGLAMVLTIGLGGGGTIGWPAMAAAQQVLCAGDCDRGGAVEIAELIRGVSIALGGASVNECASLDLNEDGAVTVNEIVIAVGEALGGCIVIRPGEVPILTDDQFERAQLFGKLVPAPANEREAAEQRAAEQFEADTHLIEQFVARNPQLQKQLLATTHGTARGDGNVEVLISGESGDEVVQLYGQRLRYRTIAAGIEKFYNLHNQRRLLTELVQHASINCQANVPDPTRLAGLSVDDLIALNRQLAQCVLIERGRTGASRRTETVAAGAAVNPTEGSAATGKRNRYAEGDRATPSSPSNKLYTKHLWPGKAYESPIKNQQVRGTCAAFATAAAMEQSLSRLTGATVNFSEQWIYALGKLELDGVDSDHDGLPLPSLLDLLAATTLGVPFETNYPYNPSPDRASCHKDDACDFAHSCASEDASEQYPGVCTNTTHQQVTMQYDGHLYYYLNYYNGGHGNVRYAIEIGDLADDDRAILKAFVSFGYSSVIGIDVVPSWKHAVKYEGGYWPGTDDGDYLLFFLAPDGGHALHVSAYLDNAELKAGVAPGRGGGWFVIKNSWGLRGDQGYVYMSAEGLGNVLQSAEVLLAERDSSANRPPDVFNRTAVTNVAQGGTLNLDVALWDDEDGERCCVLDWESNVEGYLANNRPTHDVGAPESKATLEHTFVVPGENVITVTATDSEGKSSRAVVFVTVGNEAPAADIVQPASGAILALGAPYHFIGSGTDSKYSNDPDDIVGIVPIPCSGLSWSSSDPADAINGKVGCDVTSAFATAGPRDITLQADDGDVGGVGTKTIHVSVVDPGDALSITIASPQPGQSYVVTDVTLVAQITASDWESRAYYYGAEVYGKLGNGTWMKLYPLSARQGLSFDPATDRALLNVTWPLTFSCATFVSQLRVDVHKFGIAPLRTDEVVGSRTVQFEWTGPAC